MITKAFASRSRLLVVLLVILDLSILVFILIRMASFRSAEQPRASLLITTPTPKLLNPELAWVKHASFHLPPTLSISYDEYAPSCGSITDKPQTASDPERMNYTYIYFCFNKGLVPTGFRYNLGPVHNPPPNSTVKPFTINGYVGIRGKVFSPYYGAEGEVVDLQSPYGGYAHIHLQHGDSSIFNQVLSVLHFHP